MKRQHRLCEARQVSEERGIRGNARCLKASQYPDTANTIKMVLNCP